MLRSMYAGVSGLKAHMNKMDIVGNNIANVNTTGYKGSRATFKSMLSQTIQGASAPQNGKGGSNPQQIGLGVSLGSIDKDMGQGNLQSTGRNTDLAIQGNGFFIVNDGTSNLYTRAGSTSFDKEGYLVSTTNGSRLQGWTANASGSINTDGDVGDIALKQSMPAKATRNINYSGNLNPRELTLNSSTFEISDGSGNTDTINVSMSKSGANQWEFILTASGASTFTDTGTNSLTGYIDLNADGTIASINSADDGTGTDYSGPSGIQLDDVDNGSNSISLDLPSTGSNINSVDLFKTPNTGETVNTNYDGKERTITTDVYDSQGNKHTVSLTAKKTAENEWTIKENDVSVSGATANGAVGEWFGGSNHTITFDSNGNVATGGTIDLAFDPDGGASSNQQVTLDFSGLTQYSGDSTADVDTVDGYQAGSLQKFAIDNSGTITGSYDNGNQQVIGKVAVATFNNAAGLTAEGDTLFKVSNNSGPAKIGEPGAGGFGSLTAGTLEMSNVDLSKSFTEMITTQRGFQANSKTISTSDEILQELVNLKR